MAAAGSYDGGRTYDHRRRFVCVRLSRLFINNQRTHIDGSDRCPAVRVPGDSLDYLTHPGAGRGRQPVCKEQLQEGYGRGGSAVPSGSRMRLCVCVEQRSYTDSLYLMVVARNSRSRTPATVVDLRALGLKNLENRT